MNVPPFIPSQIEIPGNVAEEKYLVRVGFVRRVVLLHTAFVSALLGLSLLPWPPTDLWLGAGFTLASLLALSLVRGLAKGWRHEQLLSVVCVPGLAVGVTLLVRSAVEAGVPFWVMAVVPATMMSYAMLCGRDWSFVGMFVIASLVTTAAVGALIALGGTDLATAAEMWFALEAYAFFYVYDLAALQTRRRLGEEVGAVLDLFRDLLNFTTYPIRVVAHWRRHRIWSLRG